MNFILVEWEIDDEFFVSGKEKVNEFFISVEEKKARRSCNNISERRCELKANRAGEERSDEQAGILSDNISGTCDSEELLVLSALYYIITDKVI